MPRLLFLNDYPMQEARRLHASGLYPSQHLWGTAELPALGWTVVDFPDRTWLGAPAKWRFTVQQVQAAMLARQREVDVVYSACQFNTWLLARMRRAGLLKVPLVTMVHHPLRGPLQNRAYVQGHDALLFLNRSVEEQSRRRFADRLPLCQSLWWGPDLRFAADIAPEGPPVDVIAAGKSHRDFATLVRAANGAAWTVAVYCAHRNLAGLDNVPGNVTVHANESGLVLSYPDLYARVRSARLVAIPLAEVDALAGLTSVLDALALGLPLVMTRNRWLDFDPEREGVGLTVEPGDAQGWRRSIDHILCNPQLERDMGRRARDLAERGDMRRFAAELSDVLWRAVEDERLRRQG